MVIVAGLGVLLLVDLVPVNINYLGANINSEDIFILDDMCFICFQMV